MSTDDGDYRISQCRANNIFHNVVYRIVFVLLRLNNVTALKKLLTKCKLVSRLIDCLEEKSPSGKVVAVNPV